MVERLAPDQKTWVRFLPDSPIKGNIVRHTKGFLKLKKEIEELPDYDKGVYASFWLGYIHGIVDYKKYENITEEEGIELEDLFEIEE